MSAHCSPLTAPQSAVWIHVHDVLEQVAKYLEANGVKGEDRVRCVVEGGAGHTESAWARRFPEALEFLAGPWWHAAAAGKDDRLSFTSPTRPCAGKPAALFFNRARSDALRDSSGVPQVNIGFNEWRAEGTQDVQMRPAPWLGLRGDWWVAPFKVTATAYEMNFVFSNGTDAWDNNGGNNFYQKVRALNLAAAGDAGPQLPLDKLAQCNSENLYFTYPSHLVAGGPVQVCRGLPWRNPRLCTQCRCHSQDRYHTNSLAVFV